MTERIAVLAFIAGKMYDKFQTFNIAYYSAAALLILAALMVFALKPPKHLEG